MHPLTMYRNRATSQRYRHTAAPLRPLRGRGHLPAPLLRGYARFAAAEV